MTYFWVGFIVAASFAFGAFQHWRRVTDKANIVANKLAAEAIAKATADSAASAMQYAQAAEHARVSMDLVNSAIIQSVLVAKHHSESATSAMDAAESVCNALKEVVALWEHKTARDQETAMLEREMHEVRRAAEKASLAATMEVLSEATQAANASAKAASNAAAAVVEAAELYCEQLGVPRRSDAAQRRRWDMFTSLTKSGTPALEAIEKVGQNGI